MSDITFIQCAHPGSGACELNKQVLPMGVDVIFGVAGKNCEGMGICQIIPSEPVRVHWKCPSVRANISAGGRNGLRLVFERNTFPKEYFERYFKGQVFRVEAAYPLSPSILSRLNLQHYVVAAGRYKVEVSERFIIIDL